MIENKLVLPADAMTHSDSNIEWWYFFSFLNGTNGSKYAVMCSFFRIGEFDCKKGHYVIYTLINLNSKTHESYSMFDKNLKITLITLYLPFYLLLHPSDTKMWKLYWDLLRYDALSNHQYMKKGVIKKDSFSLQYGDNNIVFKGENLEEFQVTLKNKTENVELHFTPTKPIALIGGDGKPDDLYYLSYTRNNVSGKIYQENGFLEGLHGVGWFDHQWGRIYEFGWNWVGLLLDDGRELLLNEMITSKSSKSLSPMANLIEKDGVVKFTRNIDFKEMKFWRSFKTNAKYPVEWLITIPEFAIEVHVKAMFNKQEMFVLGPIQAIWEGAVTFTGTERGNRISGKGFMELVGYAEGIIDNYN